MARRLLQRWRRFRGLKSGDRWLVVEAVVLIGVAQAGLLTLPFATLRRLQSGVKRWRPRRQQPPARNAWAVSAAARVVPARTCLTDALAADVMLCRRGYPSTLRLGVRKQAGAAVPVEAHAWVESDGAIVAGELATLDEYSLLSSTGVAGS
jgi:hypothetical protein